MGGEVGEEWIHVHVGLSPLAVHLKLPQHCWLAVPQYKIKRLKKEKKSAVFTSQGYIGEFTGSPSKEDPESIRNPSDRPAAAWPGWDLQVRTAAQNSSVGVPPAPTWFSPRDTFGGGACEPRRRHRSLSSFLGSLAPLANHLSYLISPSVALLCC